MAALGARRMGSTLGPQAPTSRLALALTHVIGDWAEYAHTLGFETWSHARRPCLFCKCSRETLYEHV
eukprot:9641499-Alexandrium_andersonii.AAC.1